MLSDTVVREEDWTAFAADAEAQGRDTPYLLLYSRRDAEAAADADGSPVPDATNQEDGASSAEAV